MAERLTLSELKAQNESEEQVESVEETDKPVDEYIEVDPETEDPASKEDEVKVEEEAEEVQAEDLEAWQKSDDNSEDSNTKINNSGWKRQRLKTKALKAENKEKDLELRNMQAQIDALTNNQPVQVEEEKPPTLEDSGFDEEEHQKALTEYLLKRVDSKLQVNQQSIQAQEQQAQAKIQQETAVNRHYEQASNLINEKKITEDGWINADRSIRQTLDSVNPGQGDIYAEQLIAILNNSGEGSDKVWYYLGNNQEALTNLTNTLKQDPTGMRTAVYLGQIQQKATQPIRKKRSEAPAPANKIVGDKPVNLSKAQKDYDKMTDPQQRISFKRKQKRAGVDTSKW